MKYLHTMVRVRDIDASLRFYCEGLGLKEMRRMENAQGKFTLVFLAAPDSPEAEVELTYNWGSTEDYGSARNFGHLAFRVDDIYATCQRLMDMGYVISRPPRDGHMAFVRSPWSRWKSCRTAICRRPNRGSRCRTPGSGSQLSPRGLPMRKRQAWPPRSKHSMCWIGRPVAASMKARSKRHTSGCALASAWNTQLYASTWVSPSRCTVVAS